ncbi:MAG TPA: histidine kinase [Candidatus Lumbricidophila sp.]|nr:histidine kinase [Candidatus Lumbricidophila sp.]
MSTGLVWLNAGVALVAITAVVFRRRYPGVISIGLSALTFISSAAFPASALALVSLATRRRMVPLVVSSILFAAANVVNQYTTVSFTGGSPNPRFEPMLLLPSVLLSTVFVSALVGWGIAVGNRRELIRTLSDRAERAEAERETRAESARITERSRIAREMHDVLAHRITQISMQAGALSYRGDLTADELRAGTAQVRDLANSALDELRGVLGVLRTRDGALLTAPQPTLHDIDALIEEWRGHGMRIEFTAELATGAAPSALTGRTLYRAIQEALTNAGKHAPGAAVSVRLSGDAAAGITLVVRNPHGVRKGDLPQSGFGLVGLRERIDAVGGTLEVTSADGEFCILVRVPWSA